MQISPANDEASADDEPVLGVELAGYIEFAQDQTSYVGSAHWLAIMRNV